MKDQDKLIFADDPEREEKTDLNSKPGWKVLVVDDEPQIHVVTKFVLESFEWENRGLKFYDAHSAAEAREILHKEQDIAVCLVDVVMESNDAGLNLVKYIRDELQNTQVRIVLRTGQPGYAPEKSVIRDYDINDYKDKTELTEIKLHTLMCSALRSYRDIMRLENNRIGLESVIEASARIFETTSLQKFTSAVLTQLTSLLGLNRDALFLKVISGFSVMSEKGKFQVLAAIGLYEDLVGTQDLQKLDENVRALLEAASNQHQSFYGPDYLVLYSESKLNCQHLLYIQHHGTLTDLDKQRIDLFTNNTSIAFENHTLREDLEEAQKEMIYQLSEAVENRSIETGNHIRRVSKTSYQLAKALGYTEDEARLVKTAAPLHDIGKIGIPDNILHKPGKLDADEWEIMKTHVDIGYNMLKKSDRPVMQYAALIARDHHEKWDGAGYPRGAVGEDIHQLGRIVAVADVFDALVNRRCYKDAWGYQKALELIQSQSGKHFDPEVVKCFVDNFSKMQDIQNAYTDP